MLFSKQWCFCCYIVIKIKKSMIRIQLYLDTMDYNFIYIFYSIIFYSTNSNKNGESDLKSGNEK